MEVTRISFFLGLLLCCLSAHSQDGKGAFSSALHMALNASQIDGDGTSGYNKFGYTIGTVIAQNLQNKWQYETGIAFSERGSRYPFNPDLPRKPAFHYCYQSVDIPLFFNKTIDSRWKAGVGIRTTFLIKAQEMEGMHLNVQQDSRKTGLLVCAKAQYKVNKTLSYRVELQYSMVSVAATPAGSLFFPTGAYHNCISAGIQYSVSSKAE
ncbi:MAG: PorT family protein [Bacteroidetes bacterium]|nr:PorT family protein [Bacteroidota bacterium]